MIYKPTFLNQNRPLNCCMIQSRTALEASITIRNGAFDGCDAYGYQYCKLNKAERNEETLKRIFSYADGKPIYVTNYRASESAGQSDEELFEDMTLMLDCGATLVDMMGDYFCRTEGELTMDRAAVEKQKEYIKLVHDRGGEVLMSSHVLKYTPAERVLEIAMEHQSRGADISKIVTAANSVEEELEALSIIAMLRKKLDIPFLFLCGGSHTQLVRTVGPALGCVMWLSVQRHDELSTKVQPLTRAITQIRDNFSWTQR